MKIVLVFLSIFVGIIGDMGLINKFWIPSSVRHYFVKPKYSAGECLAMPKRWGVNPKQVISYKDNPKKSGYLLKDLDKYEHYQYISLYEVDRFAQKVTCRKI